MENTKNNNLLVILLLLLLIASCGFIVYDKILKKENNNTNTQETITSELAVSLAKEKLYEANHFEFDSDFCDQDRIKDDFYCYYGSISDLKEKFYEIYSTKLSLKDVFTEYDPKTKSTTSNIIKSNSYDDDYRVTSYLLDGDYVWLDTSCRASGGAYELIDYKLESVTKDKIEVSYVERENWDDYLFHEKLDGKSEQEAKKVYDDISNMTRRKIVLVNENNEWKILSASVKDNCGFGYNVGK